MKPVGGTASEQPPASVRHEVGEIDRFECRPGCGACCIELSISSSIPGMSDGKPAGVRCVQLDDDYLCLLFGDPARPEVCRNLRPDPEMCGTSREDALRYLAWLEEATRTE